MRFLEDDPWHNAKSVPEDACETCSGAGWIVEHTGRGEQWNQEQQDCPDCKAPVPKMTYGYSDFEIPNTKYLIPVELWND